MMDAGIYLMRFRFNNVDYARKVLVDDGGYYRFVDQFDKPLPDSLPLSVEVGIKSGSEFIPICRLDPNDETLHWNDANETTPDEGMLVLIKAPYAPEPVWLAYLDSNVWHYIDATEVGEDVAFWTDLPVGPVDDEDKANGVTADLLPRQPLLSNAVAKATSGIGFGEGLNHG